jgi:hypothetical protein
MPDPRAPFNTRKSKTAFSGDCEQPSAALMLQWEEEVHYLSPRLVKDKTWLDLRALSLWRGRP